MRFRPANIRLINRRLNLPRLLLALSSTNGKSNDNDKINPTDSQGLTGYSISDEWSFVEERGSRLGPAQKRESPDGQPFGY